MFPECFLLEAEVEQGLTSHQTHYTSYRGRVTYNMFGGMLNPTQLQLPAASTFKKHCSRKGNE